MIVTDDRPRCAEKSKYELIKKRIEQLLRGKQDLGCNIRCTNQAFLVVDIGRMIVRRPLTEIQIREINNIKEVIEKEFPSKFSIHSNRVGSNGYRVQMHIPLL